MAGGDARGRKVAVSRRVRRASKRDSLVWRTADQRMASDDNTKRHCGAFFAWITYYLVESAVSSMSTARSAYEVPHAC